MVVQDYKPLDEALSPDIYWKNALAGCECTSYPSLPPFLDRPEADRMVEYRFEFPNQIRKSESISMLTRAAWALIAGHMTDSEDVVFGVSSSSRERPLIPLRIQPANSQCVGGFVDTVKQQAIEMIPFEATDMEAIARISLDCQQACMFQTVMVFDQAESWQLQRFKDYSLIIRIEIKGKEISASASIDPRVVEPQLAFKLLRRLDFVMQQLSSANADSLLGHLETIPPSEWAQIQEWNSSIPAVVERCIHTVFEQCVLDRPHAPAVCAWDGELSYQELARLTTNLACHLVGLGVGPEQVVPLCFEKSMWTVVAMFSVLKAGGAFILLDPGLPETRIRNICERVKAFISITSVSCEPRLSSCTPRNLVLSKSTAEGLQPETKETLSQHVRLEPANAAYIIFTSGSTGEPKGCVVEHRSYCSAAFGHGKILGMKSTTRALQFGSYNFAGAIMEMVMTLMYGGCVCIPSEEDRAINLPQAIRKLNANWAFLTSTVLALISPDSVPSLKTVCVGGEPIRSSQVRDWAPKVELRQTYGSAETAAVVASSTLNASSAVTDVGHPTTARAWLTSPGDINRLVPIGAPGEVIFEGAVIGREYVGNLEKTSQAFISIPAWRAEFGTHAVSSRFYRTGDLASYRSDGSIELLGRKDTQVKLRGQRIELGEIEHQARLSSSDLKEVAVDLTILNNSAPALICFLVTDFSPRLTNEEGGKYLDRVYRLVQTVRSHLANILPHYMVPSVLLPISALPLTASGKTDRRRLRQIGSELSAQQVQELQSMTEGCKGQPTTESERQLQKIWSDVLKIEQSTIGLSDSFFRLGGDSISAMKVAAEARKLGMDLLMADIFRNDTIVEIAAAQPPIAMRASATSRRLDGASLIETSRKEALLHLIDSQEISIRSVDVVDIHPLTGVQNILVASSVTFGHMADYFFADLSGKTDLADLETSCRRVFEKFPILRACWLNLDGAYWQVVLHETKQAFRTIQISGDMENSFREFCIADVNGLSPTEPTASFVLFRHDTQGLRLGLRMNHAQYDAFSAPIVFQSIFDLDENIKGSIKPDFLEYLSYASNRRSQSIKHWSRFLKGSQISPIVPHTLPPAESRASAPDVVSSRAEAHLDMRTGKITAATLVRSAWAILISSVAGVTDIAYGQVITGRNAAILDVEKIVGCCLNIVPERINLASYSTVSQMVHAVQEQFLEMGDADSLDFRDILKECTEWPAEATFDSVLHHREVDAQLEIRTSTGITRVQLLDNPLMSPFIFVVSTSKGDVIDLEIIANTHLMTTATGEIMVKNLANIVQKLCSCTDMLLSSFMDKIRFKL